MAVIKLKRLWRGLDRQRLNAAESGIKMLTRRDQKTYENSDEEGELAFFFIEEDDTALNDAVNLVLARIAACKAAKY